MKVIPLDVAKLLSQPVVLGIPAVSGLGKKKRIGLGVYPEVIEVLDAYVQHTQFTKSDLINLLLIAGLNQLSSALLLPFDIAEVTEENANMISQKIIDGTLHDDAIATLRRLRGEK